MNILLNFSNLKIGGGQNVALNFLYSIEKNRLEDYYYFVANNSKVKDYVDKYISPDRYYVVSSNPIKRIVFEKIFSYRLLEKWNINIIYSYFGFGLYPRSIPQVMGCAESNLFFPEINFWSHYHGISRIIKKVIDYYRIYGLKRVQGIIFETELLEKRFHDLYTSKAQTITIKPSIYSLDSSATFEFNRDVTSSKIGLFLCGWQLNKNVMMIPQIAYEMKKNNFPFVFLLTAPLDNSDCHKRFVEMVMSLNVEEYIYLSGQIPKMKLSSLYSQIDFVFLLSKLESFSNNIIESWSYDKVLIISDEQWAHEICKGGAVYVNRDSPKDIATTIINLSDDFIKCKEVVNRGRELLNSYPTVKEKTKKEFEFVRSVYETMVLA